MDNTDLKKLGRRELLEILVAQGEELEATKTKLAEAEAALQEKTIAINEAGSIAEAALKLNGVFEAAQNSCQQYIANIIQLNQRQKTICTQMEEEASAKADQILAEASEKARLLAEDAEQQKAAVKSECDAMLQQAKQQADSYWAEVSARLEAFTAEHSELTQLLALALEKKQG